MTDRINSFTVALTRDVREDDIDHIRQALLMVKGVQAVEPNVVDVNVFVYESRANNRWRHAILDLLDQQTK